MLRLRGSLAVLVGLVVVLTGCSSGSPGGVDTTVTSTQTVTGTPKTITPVVPKPFALAQADAPPQPPGGTLPAGEVEQTCPYIKAGLNIEPTTETNFADIEGSRVQRVTVLTTLKPVGCRFYWFNDFHPTGDILPSTYATADEAYNAMVVTAKIDPNAQGDPSFAPGIAGISFQTKLNAADNGKNWAFAFAKGKVMVVVRTDQTDTSNNARLIAEALVGKF